MGAAASGIGSRIRSLLGCQRARIEYPAAEYQLDDLRVRVNSFPGVSANQQQIGALADLHRADLVVQLQGSRVAPRRHLKDLCRRHARIDQVASERERSFKNRRASAAVSWNLTSDSGRERSFDGGYSVSSQFCGVGR
jgi:hypothetical protein